MNTNTKAPTKKPPILGSVTVEDPGEAPLNTATAALEYANKLVIKSDEDYASAASDLQDLKAKATAIEADRKKRKSPVDLLISKLQGRFKQAQDTIARAEAIVKQKLLAYKQLQDAKRREEQARADENTRKQQERLQGQADRALAAGKTERAEALQANAASLVAPVIAIEAPKISGLTMRQVWSAECTDLSALVLAVAANIIRDRGGLDNEEVRKTLNTPSCASLAYLTANDKALRNQARTLKDQFVCPGVRVTNDEDLSSRSSTSDLP